MYIQLNISLQSSKLFFFVTSIKDVAYDLVHLS